LFLRDPSAEQCPDQPLDRDGAAESDGARAALGQLTRELSNPCAICRAVLELRPDCARHAGCCTNGRLPETNTHEKETVVKSNLKALLVGAAMAIAGAGCAHGTSAVEQGRAVRGGGRVGRQARVLMTGPAREVHATGDKPVRWFVADQKAGDDRDCAASTSASLSSESDHARLTVKSGQVLCAAVAAGATDVMWHKLPDADDGLWALR
jgi:hypothetical protein